MAEITAQLVKELRDKSGVGMMDCKRALQEAGGDIEAAMDWLRAKGLSKAAKKADRVAAEGVVAVALRDDGAGMTGAVIELNAETDFVARNEQFQAGARKIAVAALDVDGLTPKADGDVQALNAAMLANGQSVSEMITGLIATIGENMLVRRAARFVVAEGAVAAYIHNAAAPDLGRIGVLVALKSDAPHDRVQDIGRKVAMHIAATQPLALTVEEIDPAVVSRERAILMEKAADSGKPANVVEKMVEGGLRKFYEESVLLKQTFVIDQDHTVESYVVKAGKDLGHEVTITGFVRLALGEGVEKQTDDFAGEVAALTGGQG